LCVEPTYTRCALPPLATTLLEVLADPEHDEHESMLEWVGGGFDAEHFDLAAVNESLSFMADRRQR
jgi:hypothetical protein